MDKDFGINQAFVEELFLRYQENRSTVSEGWTRLFDQEPEAPREPHAHGANGSNGHAGNGHSARAPTFSYAPPVASTTPAPGSSLPPGQAALQGLAQRVEEMINAYRLRGHLWADLDPLGLTERPPRELNPESFDLNASHLDAVVPTGDLAGPPEATVREIIARLEDTYCRTIGVEFMHIEDRAALSWLQREMEASNNRTALTAAEQRHLLGRLIDAEIFEQFLHTNFLGKKRFSLEGGESLIPLLDLMIDRAGNLGVEEVVIGMAHRGRLNVLYNIMGKSSKDIFAHFLDNDPQSSWGRGDVKYHLGYSSDITTTGGQQMHLSLAFNPSHLEFVNPVVEGRVRAKQDRRGDAERKRVASLLIHGDAAFIGQGVVAETLNLMSLPGYSTGGTLHVVVNNQVGFTTSTEDARSTRYATDLARMLGTPIFHVNGEDPEAVAHVARLAVDYRQQFGRDVVIDMYCYRKWGHNEGDEPRFTQPLMYAVIDRKASVPTSYARQLMARGEATQEQVDALASKHKAALEATLAEIKTNGHKPTYSSMAGLWARYKAGPDPDVPEADTRVSEEKLQELLTKITTVPEGFNLNPRLGKFIQTRRERMEARSLDWGTAESLAFASLVHEGIPLRLSGQDARRGTFSHRQSVWSDHLTGARYTPFDAVAQGKGRYEVWDSPLSETGVLGFDYGYSLDFPDGLIMWEAQFGDFVNGAQVIIDQFISSSEDKWNRLSGITLLLPHGFEGQGPEHSSARIERFLQLCAEDNMVVCNLTSASQIFHALRRQVLRPARKPLIIMTPKSLLRAKEAYSPLEEFTEGRFHRVIREPAAEIVPEKVRKVLLCSGKVYWDLVNKRAEKKITDVAILRLEQLYPLPQARILEALAPYRDGTPLVWVQEDPWNMGGWYFIEARLPTVLKGRLPLTCVARDESASPATGSESSHKEEQKHLLERALA